MTTSTRPYTLVTVAELPAIIAEYTQTLPVIGLDLETTGLKFNEDKIVTAQWGTLDTVYILDVRPFYSCSVEDTLVWKQALKDLFNVCSTVTLHNAKFDYCFLCYHTGVRLHNIVDTQLQEQVLYGVGIGGDVISDIHVNMLDTATRYGLHVEKELQIWSVGLDKPRNFYPDGSYSFLVPSKTGKLKLVYWYSDHTPYREGCTPGDLTIMRVSTEQWTQPLPGTFLEYCTQDVVIPLQIKDYQHAELINKELLPTAQLENECIPALARLELDGMHLDVERYIEYVAEKEKELAAYTEELTAQLDVYIQEYHREKYASELEAFTVWKSAEEHILKRLGENYDTLVFPGVTWKEYKAQGVRIFREEYPRPKTPKLDTTPINMNSTQQLQRALQGVGVYVEQTNKESLEEHSHIPLIARLLEYKERAKFIAAFGTPLLEKVARDGRVHPQYRQMVSTGRMSCAFPNLQQLPPQCKPYITAQPGNMILTADLSNIELRVLAEKSLDKVMLDAFESGLDLHAETAYKMFHLDRSVDVKKAEYKPGISFRQVAKKLNFTLMYGAGAHNIAHALGISVSDAQIVIDDYFGVYEGVYLYLEESGNSAIELGYSTTVGGRKRFYDVPFEPIFNRRTMLWDDFAQTRKMYNIVTGSIKREAKNAPIQGTCADMIKHALVLLNKYAPASVKFIACVHDEIVLECPSEIAEHISTLLSKAMTTACTRYLHTVHVPPVEVNKETYWKK